MLISCCGCAPEVEDCPETLIDFDDGTYGLLVNTGSDPPWQLDHIDFPGQVYYTLTSDGQLLWTKPITDAGMRTVFRVTATVIGDGETDSNGGGVTIAGADWQAWFGLEDGTLTLRYLDSDGQEKEKIAGINVGTDITLTLVAYSYGVCGWYTIIKGYSDTGHEVQFTVRKDIQVASASLPADIQMGIFLPPAGLVPGDLLFPECCPSSTHCYSDIDVEGSGPDGGEVVSLTRSTSSLLCGGSPVSLTGFDPADGYWIGSYPYPYAEVENWKVVLYCDYVNGVMRSAILGDDGCVIETGTYEASGCDPFYASFTHAAIGIEPIILTYTGDIVECPGERRAFDNVRLQACTGNTTEPCESSFDPDNPNHVISGCYGTGLGPEKIARCWLIDFGTAKLNGDLLGPQVLVAYSWLGAPTACHFATFPAPEYMIMMRWTASDLGGIILSLPDEPWFTPVGYPCGTPLCPQSPLSAVTFNMAPFTGVSGITDMPATLTATPMGCP